MNAGQGQSALAPRHIVLTGFMGAGKSTVGRILAARLGWPFLDIDERICGEQALTVAEIFARHGEPHFRVLEAEAVTTALQGTQAVIALGGGAIETEAIRTLLFPSSHGCTSHITLYLEAPLAEMLARCRSGTTIRPLLADARALEDRLLRRMPHYQRAHHTVATGGRSPEAVVNTILMLLPASVPAAAPGPSPGDSPSSQQGTAR